MHRSTDFSSVVRDGARSRTRRLVVHQRLDAATGAPIIGLVVSKAVGGSVVRNRVSRRLRAQLVACLDLLAPGSGTVVRALPPAARATSAELAADLDRAFDRSTGPR